MSNSWVEACWERRHEVGFKISQLDVVQYKQLPFTGCVVALHGFPSEEEAHMTEIATSNGVCIHLSLCTEISYLEPIDDKNTLYNGLFTASCIHLKVYTYKYYICLFPIPGAVVSHLGASGDKPVTHLVVCNEVDVSTLPHTSSRIHAVKQQWFWESIQIDVCADENFYRVKVQ